MVPSLYNIIAPTHDGQGHVLYNTDTTACILVDDAELAQYRAIVEGDVTEGDLFDTLDRLGFLVNDRQSELDFKRYEFERSKFENSVLEMLICPSLNFDRLEPNAFGSKREGIMAAAVQDAIVDFAREQHDHQPFTILKPVWVAADVQALSVVDGLNERLGMLAQELGVDYWPSALLVTSDADGNLAREFRSRGIDHVESAAESERCLHCIEQPSENEDFVHLIADSNGATAPDAPGFTDLRPSGEGNLANVNFAAAGLTNFAQATSLDEDVFVKRAHVLLDDFLNQSPTQEDFEEFLRPLRTYCNASVERSYAIDELGNAYGSTYDLGCEELVLFNVCEPMETRTINMKLMAKRGIANPLDLEECANCRVYPLCCGGCERVRMDEGALTCVPQRYIIEDYLTAYSRFF